MRQTIMTRAAATSWVFMLACIDYLTIRCENRSITREFLLEFRFRANTRGPILAQTTYRCLCDECPIISYCWREAGRSNLNCHGR